ncbi:MAG TPA: type II toxin-antitoxin system RelE/ParE family toxin [Hyphomicrobiaceae bacterium]|nr:type II toxin-antitoxin system RelE/ParE family toxin [Hyphomicrobiaceae bacterium]
MAEVILSPEARDDLLSIVAHLVAVAGLPTADKWDRKLWAAIDGLQDFPGSGAPRAALGAHTRIVAVRPYIVIYEHVRASKLVHVLCVFHGRRNITQALLKT